MQIVYSISVLFYGFIIRLASLFSVKARLWVKGRKNFFSQFSFTNPEKSKIIWFHASSLGEFEQGRPVIEAYRSLNPQHKIVLTFFSPSGYEIRKNYANADYICYLPLDTPRNACRFIDRIQPSAVFFIKYDFWYHYINTISKRKIPLYLISAVFRENQIFFKPWGRWYASLLRKFDHIFVQNENSALLLKTLHLNNVTVTGDTRFDRVHAIAMQQTENELIKKFAGNHFVIVGGSTWPADEALLFQFLQTTQHPVRLMIAPHEIDENHIAAIEKLAGNNCRRYTQGNIDDDTRVLIIDTMGMLASLYRYGKIAYIGGGFGKGIHNILEAATYGLPVVFGPNYHKFNEATGLISLGGAFSIKTQHELISILNKMIEQPAFLKHTSDLCSQFVKNNLGATQRIFSVLKA